MGVRRQQASDDLVTRRLGAQGGAQTVAVHGDTKALAVQDPVEALRSFVSLHP